MMTIRDVKDFIRVFDEKYDDFKIVLWDFQNQREGDFGGGHSFSKEERNVTIPITLPPVDGEYVFDKLSRIQKRYAWTTCPDTPKNKGYYDVCCRIGDKKRYFVEYWNGENWLDDNDEKDVSVVAWHRIIEFEDNE